MTGNAAWRADPAGMLRRTLKSAVNDAEMTRAYRAYHAAQAANARAACEAHDQASGPGPHQWYWTGLEFRCFICSVVTDETEALADMGEPKGDET